MEIPKTKNSTKNSNSITGIEDVKLSGSSNQAKKGSLFCCPCCCIPCFDPCFTYEILCVLAICRIFCRNRKRSSCKSCPNCCSDFDNYHNNFFPMSI